MPCLRPDVSGGRADLTLTALGDPANDRREDLARLAVDHRGSHVVIRRRLGVDDAKFGAMLPREPRNAGGRIDLQRLPMISTTSAAIASNCAWRSADCGSASPKSTTEGFRNRPPHEGQLGGQCSRLSGRSRREGTGRRNRGRRRYGTSRAAPMTAHCRPSDAGRRYFGSRPREDGRRAPGSPAPDGRDSAQRPCAGAGGCRSSTAQDLSEMYRCARLCRDRTWSRGHLRPGSAGSRSPPRCPRR